MLILRKNRNYLYKPLKLLPPPKYDIESLMPLPIPKHTNQRLMSFDLWKTVFALSIENIVEYVYNYLSSMKQAGYAYYINKVKIRETLTQYIYNVSSNSYKSSHHLKQL